MGWGQRRGTVVVRDHGHIRWTGPFSRCLLIGLAAVGSEHRLARAIKRFPPPSEEEPSRKEAQEHGAWDANAQRDLGCPAETLSHGLDNGDRSGLRFVCGAAGRGLGRVRDPRGRRSGFLVIGFLSRNVEDATEGPGTGRILLDEAEKELVLY